MVCHGILGVYLFVSNRRRDREQIGEGEGVNCGTYESGREELAEDMGMMNKTEVRLVFLMM